MPWIVKLNGIFIVNRNKEKNFEQAMGSRNVDEKIVEEISEKFKISKLVARIIANKN